MHTVAIISVTIFIAAFIRGYTGFAFGAITGLILSAYYPVSDVVPGVLLTDLIIGIPLVTVSWKHTNFTNIKPLLLSTALGIPFGLIILHYVSEPNLKLLVPLTVISLALLPYAKSRKAKILLNSPWVCGMMSGWTTSAVSAGGAPVIIHLKYKKLPIDIQRNTLITYFFITTLLTVALNLIIHQELHTLPGHTYLWTGLSITGVIIGKWLFKRTSIPSIHSLSYYFMILISFWSLIQAVINYNI